MTRRAIVMDLDRCTGCMSCIVACKFENNIDLGNYWSDVVDMGPYGTHPDIKMYWLPLQCQQCTDAPCVDVCPTGATYRDPDNNVVLVSKSDCIGCRMCAIACPFSDSEAHHRPSVRWFNKAEGVVEKCTLCNHLCANSDGHENPSDPFDPAHAVPACVHNCATGCRYYGDLDDPNSAASQAIAAAEAAGKPTYTLSDYGADASFVYILSKDISDWHGLDGRVLQAPQK